MYVVFIFFVLLAGPKVANAPPPLRVTIDCGPDETDPRGNSILNPKGYFTNTHFDVDSFCRLIHRAIPKTVKDGKFVLVEPETDQTGFSDTSTLVAVAPPNGFRPALPRLRFPKLRVPKLKVPKLKNAIGGPSAAPRIGKPMTMVRLKESFEEESSAERMEKFKKGVQKMLHFVKVLGQLDQYLSERTRIVIDKLSKTLAE